VFRSSRGGLMPRIVLTAAVAALAVAVAGCEAGNNAPSLEFHPPTAGTGTTLGNITISNVFVLGAPIGHALRRGQNAGLFLALTNTGRSADVLTSITAPGIASSVLLPGGHITLLPDHSILLTGPRPAVILQDLLVPLTGGTVIQRLTLTFANAGSTTLRVPVMPRALYYTTLSPAPSPSPSGSPSASPGGSASPLHKKTGKKASASSSPSPSPTSTP
jgi:copper(I)-binding protein